jgi:DNA-binding CsgD family transcriptional regulator
MGDLTSNPLLQTVNLIYEAALDAGLWPKVVESLCEVMDAPKAKLFTPLLPAEKGGLSLCVGIPEAANQLWSTHYMQHDVWVQAGFAKGLIRQGNIVLDSDLVPAEEFEQSKIYREHLRLFDIGRLCSGIVFDGSAADLTATFVSVVRGLRRPFATAERKKMEILVPHLSRALGLMYRLRDAELKVATSLATLDRLPSGVILIDRVSRIVYSNREASTLVASREGLTDINGFLGVHDSVLPKWQALLKSLIEPVSAEVPHFSEAVLVPRPGKKPLILQAAPIAGHSAFPRQAVGIVFLVDVDKKTYLDRHVAADLYGATPAELNLAEHLCGGDTVSHAAAKLSISEATARTQLASLFAKTGTHRQADLIRALMSLQRPSP